MKIRLIHSFILALLIALFSCDGKSPETVVVFTKSDAGEREDALRKIQAEILDSNAEKTADTLIRAAGRKKSIEPGLIREAIDFTPLTTEYFAIQPSDVLQVAGRSDGRPLMIRDYGPIGELPVENRRPNIYVMFNKPIVPLGQLGKPIFETDLLTITPPVDGVYRWYGTRTLGFRPDRPLQDRPKYTISVSSHAAALDGETLGAAFSFDVFGEKVKMVNMFPGDNAGHAVNLYDVPVELARQLTVEFNQPVDPSHIAASMTVSANGQSLAYRVSRPNYPEHLAERTDRAVLLSLERRPPEDSTIEVTLQKGAVPFPDYPPSTRSQSYRLRTIRPFESEGLSAYPGSFPRDNRPALYPVYLRFSHPMEEASVPEEFQIDIDGQRVKSIDITASWSTIALYLADIAPGMEVEVIIPEGIRDIHGREAASSRESITIPRPKPMVDFPYHYDGLRHLEAEFPPALVWTSRNIVEGQFGIAGKANYFDDPEFTPLMGPLDLSTTIPDLTYFHREDLAEHLNPSGRGTVYMNYRLRKDPSQVDTARQWDEEEVAVQVTNLGITVRAAYNKVLVWVNRLSDGEAVEDADITVFNLFGTQYSGRSDAEGLTVIPIPPGEFAQNFYNISNTRADNLHVRAEKSDDLAEMRISGSHSPYAFGIYSTERPEDVEQVRHRIHMFTDRGLYKGGEELALRGIHWLQNPKGFNSYLGPYRLAIVESETDTVIWSETGETSRSGGFSHRLRLPDDLEPGNFTAQYRGSGFSGSVGFRIASFRRVNFQVNANTEKNDYFHGDTVEAAVQAESLSGGVLPSAPYHYFWTRKPFRFVPPGPQWEHWTFGTSAWAGEQRLSSGDGSLSGSGTVRISEGTVAHEVTGKAYRYTLETTVENIDRQVVTARAQAIVHPATYYIGARFSQGSVDGWWSTFVSAGELVTGMGKLVDIEGRPVHGGDNLRVGLIKKEWKSVQQQGLYGRISTQWEYAEEEVWRKDHTLKKGEAQIAFTPETPGSYTLFMEYTDEEERISRSEIDFYASGSGWVATAGRTPQDIKLIADKELYESGETARILVQSPIPSGRYLLTLEREGILAQRIVTLSGSNEVIEIPIEEHYLPVVYAALSSFTERKATEDDYFEPDLGKPRGLFGITTLRVATTPMELSVNAATVEDSYGPGEDAEIVITVKHDGKPVAGAEVTVLAVDRGVLDLIDYHVPNPLDYFYNEAHFPLGSIGDDSRRLLLRPVTYEVADLQGGGGTKMNERKDFNPLALFEPALVTGGDGTVRLTTSLPDTLSTYRLTAVALDGTRLGLDEDEFTVSNPVNVRSALPRRFRNRDSAAAGLVFTNTTAKEVQLRVSVESDILNVAGDAVKNIILPSKSSLELPFLLEAHKKGRGELRFTVRSDILNEVLVEQVEVEEPIAVEAFTTVGIADGANPAVETVVLPGYSVDGYGGLSLSIDSSLFPYIETSITNILDERYPSLNEELYRIAAELRLFGTADSAAGVFKELAAKQFADGGIGYHAPSMEYSRPSWFLSVLSTHIANRLARRGFTNPVDAVALDDYLLGRLAEAEARDAASFLAAWTALVLAEREKVESSDIQWLHDSEDELGIAAYNLLSQAYTHLGSRQRAKRLYERSKNFITIGTQTVTLAETYEVKEYFSTGEVELSAFLATATLRGEEAELLMRIAGALNQNRTSRRFHSLFDDFWIIEGFSNLLDEESGSQVTAIRAELAGETLIQREIESEALSISEGFPFTVAPLSQFKTQTPLELRITSDGTGTLYYSSTLRYALPVETALPRDEGIEVNSSIETLNGDILDPGSLPLGETLRVRVNLSTLVRRSFLKLTVPVPSGAEVVDASFSTTGSYGDAGGTDSESWTRETVYGDSAEFIADGHAAYGPDRWYFWFYRPMQQIYDNAVTYAWEDFYPGQREITFLIRTTTPGIYPTPPVSATTEFEPEVFGRDAGRLVVIHAE